MDQIPNFPRSFIDLGRSQFTSVRFGIFTKLDKGLNGPLIHSGDPDTINGGKIIIPNEGGFGELLIEKKRFYNCHISINRETCFTDCHFDNCYIESFSISGLNLSGCKLRSCSVQASKIAEHARSFFDKCYIVVHLTWYPMFMSSFDFSFTRYIELLRKYKKGNPNAQLDQWYYDSVAELNKVISLYPEHKPLELWRGPVKSWWGDASGEYLEQAKKDMPGEASFLIAVDQWLSSNLVNSNTYKNIIHDWAADNR